MNNGTILLFLFTAFCACLVGKICGMGGGVVIKPTLDAFGVLSVGAINFLSGCTVLGMSFWSVIRSVTKRERVIDLRISTPLAIGAALGGIAGKQCYAKVENLFSCTDTAGGVQAAILCAATVLTLLYTICQSHITTRHVRGRATCVGIGFALGILGAFLGIGGGPFNMAALYYCFSMTPKIAAQNSLYIILFSQATGVAQVLMMTGMPDVPIFLLVAMIISGVAGSEVGRAVNRHMRDDMVTRCFQMIMVLIVLINVHNMWTYLR